MNKADLNLVFEQAMENNAGFIMVHIAMDTLPDPEMIINTRPNFGAKHAYYNHAYDDDLRLLSCPSIHIIGASWGTSEAIQGIKLWGGDSDGSV